MTLPKMPFAEWEKKKGIKMILTSDSITSSANTDLFPIPYSSANTHYDYKFKDSKYPLKEFVQDEIKCSIPKLVIFLDWLHYQAARIIDWVQHRLEKKKK